MFYSGEVFTIRTFFSDIIYQNMVATSLSFNQDANTGDSLSFTLTAKKINLVKPLNPTPVEIRMKDPAGTSAAEESDKGPVTPEVKPPSLSYQVFVGE